MKPELYATLIDCSTTELGPLEYSQQLRPKATPKRRETLGEHYSLILCSKKLHKEAFLSTRFLQVLGRINNLGDKKEKKIVFHSSKLVRKK